MWKVISVNCAGVFCYSLLYLSSCSSPNPTGFSSGREHYAISETERTKLERRANNGDRDAALRLLEHHLILTRDKREIERWRARVKELERPSDR
jgi:hypothetical protein